MSKTKQPRPKVARNPPPNQDRRTKRQRTRAAQKRTAITSGW